MHIDPMTTLYVVLGFMQMLLHQDRQAAINMFNQSPCKFQQV